MENINETIITSEIQTSMKLAQIIKTIKIFFALIIIICYFINFKWLNEIIIFAVVINLLLPMNFFDVFIQKLLEYNTQKMEERILLNSQETNTYFEDNDKYKKSINDKIKDIKNKLD